VESFIRPISRTLFVCDRFLRFHSGKCNLYGIFTEAQADGFPHVHIRIVVFAEFVDGLGNVPFVIRIVDAGNAELIYETPVRHLQFQDRMTVVQFVHNLQMVPFRRPGVYLIELWSDDEFMADARFTVT
jgi:hypothetical protein